MPPARKSKPVLNGVKKTKKEEARSSPAPDDGAGDSSAAEEAAAPASKKAKKRPAKAGKRETKPVVDRGERRAVKAPERYVAPNVAPTAAKRPRSSGGQFPVQAIRGIRKSGKKLEFLVKWDGYGESDNNWEPESNVRSCSEHIKNFLNEVARTTDSYE